MSRLRKVVVGSLAALMLSPCAYVVGGNLYSIGRSAYYQKAKGEGYFNRKKNASFYQEMLDESDVLEDRLKDNVGLSEMNYTLDIVVSEEVKRFFDDKNDSSDNDDWVDYIAKSVQFLNEYNRAGIGFKIGKVTITSKEQMEKEVQGPGMCIPGQNKKMVLYFTPHTRMNEFLGGQLKGTAAFTYSNLGLMYVGVSKNRHRNASLTLHEMGHVLGLQHVPFQDDKRMFLDPFCIFYKDSFMVPNVDGCSDLKLKEEEVKQIREEHVD